MFKKNKKGELTIRYLVVWCLSVFLYFTVFLGLLVTSREAILDSLNSIETIIAGLLVLAPMAGAIYDLFNQKGSRDDGSYSDFERF